jgi:cell division protein FtsL
VRKPARFVALWTLAVVATACSFVLYLALRSRAVELGYKLGKSRAKQSQLRETRRVLQVEAVAYRNPERIDALARGVLQMEEPPPQRTFVVGAALEPTEAPCANAVGCAAAGAKASAAPTAAPTSTVSEHVEAPVLPNAAGVQSP